MKPWWTCIACKGKNANLARRCRFCLHQRHAPIALGDLINRWLARYDQRRKELRSFGMVKRTGKKKSRA